MPSGHSHSSHSSHSSSHSSLHSHSSHSSHSSSSGFHSSSSSGGSRRTIYTAPERKRYHQPLGRTPSGEYTCKHHTYYYYNKDWEYDGKSYQKGYYDENGRHYANMAIKNNRTGDTMVCVECEYCGTQKILYLREGARLTCDACGAPLDISNIPHDEEGTQETGSGINGAFLSKFMKIWAAIVTGIAILATIGGVLRNQMVSTISNHMGSYLDLTTTSEAVDPDSVEADSAAAGDNTDIWGAVVYLKEMEDGRYSISTAVDYDKYMYWDSSVESYYDYTTNSYAWYNTDVSPNLWQYWFDGISTDYEDAGYGWMEYEDGTWYMETAEGEWTDVTSAYDTSGLWHIDNEFDY